MIARLLGSIPTLPPLSFSGGLDKRRAGAACDSTGMKTIVSLLGVAVLALSYSGCAAHTSIGNRDQHGAGVAVKTQGAQKGVRAKVY